METSSFNPRPKKLSSDRVSSLLVTASQSVLVAVLGLFPILFIPSINAPLNYTKSLVVMIGVGVAVILYALSLLRQRELSISAPLALYAFWFLAAVYVISALLSGDIKDALIGDMFGVYTAAFLAFMAVIMTAMVTIGSSKNVLKGLYLALVFSGVIISIFHLSRLAFGVDFLSLGVFNGVFDSVYGMWNELAIFFGFMAISGLVIVRTLPFSKIGKAVFILVSGLSLGMLTLVNFYAIWVLVALFSTVGLIQMLVDHDGTLFRFIRTDEKNATISIAYTITVASISIFFVVFGGNVNLQAGTPYLEVRPSATATLNVMKHVLSEDPIVGIGPNKFIDAWRLYKDPLINETPLWDASFVGGSGFVPTGFATTGLAGALAWLGFLFLLLWHGWRVFSMASKSDQFWRASAMITFLSSVYLWVVAVIYTPSVPTMILTAIVTGSFFVTYQALMPTRRFSLPFSNDRIKGLVSMAVLILLIIGTIASLQVVVRHYSATYEYTKVLNMVEGIDQQEKRHRMVVAYEKSKNDVFARWVAINLVFTIESILSPDRDAVTDEQRRQLFYGASTQAVQIGRLATEVDPTEPLNWIALGQIYSGLTLAGVEGAYEMGKQAYDMALQYDPINPSIPLLKAQLEARNDNLPAARLLAREAIDMKSNYVDAFLFLAQLDVLEDNISEAISNTQKVVSLEPQNATWHYKLGTLYLSTSDYTPAITSLQQALMLDPQFANARYFLALVLAQSGDFEQALMHMREVEKTNPDSSMVKEAIATFENRGVVTLPNSPPVSGALDAATSTATHEPDLSPTLPENTDNSSESPAAE